MDGRTEAGTFSELLLYQLIFYYVRRGGSFRLTSVHLWLELKEFQDSHSRLDTTHFCRHETGRTQVKQ